MSATIEVLVATEEHARELAQTMRQGDRDELATHDREPLEVLLSALRDSKASFALMFDGKVGCMFGAAPLGGVVGEVWMLSGEPVNRHKREFLRASRVCLSILLECYPALMGAVDARYRGALRWAEWLGFRLWDEVLTGPHKAPFVPITIGGQQWAS